MRRLRTYVRFAIWTTALVLCLPSSGQAATSVTVGSDSSKHVLKGKLVTPDQVVDGELVIEGDQITCAAADCTDPPNATVFTITNAYIFPGFIDAHNHVAYNVLPKWTPPKLYQNRGQWQRAQSYKDFKRPYSDLKDAKHLFCEMVKYGEIKALISGITTIQGTSPDQTCFRTLIRNAENQNELGTPAALIRTYILDIKGFQGSVNWTATKAFVVHLGEGIDDTSRKEFDTLEQKGLLKAQTVIIHGTAFGDAEFQDMGQAGAKLVWSPQSNLALYGKTTNIPLALQHHVPVSLGVDWNPTGSNNVFDELRVAAQQNEEEFGGAIPGSDWIKMITVNPATALALDGSVGKLVQGLKADIAVMASKDPDPNQSLLKNHLQDVQMVWVGGDLLYGNKAIVEKVKPGGCEALQVYGSAKRICVKDTKAPVAKSTQTLTDIRGVLKTSYSDLAPLTP